MRGSLTQQERRALAHWLSQRRRDGERRIVPAGDQRGRADRYYASPDGRVAVEVSRLVIPEKERAEHDALSFFHHDVAPIVKDQIPGLYFASLNPRRIIPPKGTRSRRELAHALAAEIISTTRSRAAGHAGTRVFLGRDALLHLYDATQTGERAIIYGGMPSLYGGFDGPVRREAMSAMVTVIGAKAVRGQLAGQDIVRRVLILDDYIADGEPDDLDAVISDLDPDVRAAFDEIAIVGRFRRGCYRAILNA